MTNTPPIHGKDYSLYNPTKVRLGLRLWTEAYIRAMQQERPAADVRRAPADRP